MAEKEVVAELGAEGMGATVYRTALPGGGWEFHVEGTSMDFDDNDDDAWRAWSREPVPTLDEPLQSLSGSSFPWCLLSPGKVDPDYYAFVWEKVQQAADSIPEQFQAHWPLKLARWKRCCNQDPDRNPDGRPRCA